MKNSYKYYVLALLTTVGTFNYLDRQVLALVMEMIKQDFELSDSELGFLTGFAFALFYAVAGVPLARWSDRGNRNLIISLTTALWSAMVALGGMVTNFTQLVLTRVGVAVGEAGCLPPAQSLLADYFPRAERPRATAIYFLCVPFSVIVGYLLGGWLADKFGWRMTFILIGLPGVLLAILVRFTLREPRLKQSIPARAQPAPSFKVVLTTLWGQDTFRQIILAFSVSYFFIMGLSQWLPTFFIRSYGVEMRELGYWFALVFGGSGLIGGYLGGYLSSRYAACREAIQMRFCAMMFLVGGAMYVMIFISSGKSQSLIFMALAVMILNMGNGPIFSAIQSLVSERMRSVALALVFLVANLIGLSLGPFSVGLLSDAMASNYGEESLRKALSIFSPGLIWVSYYYWKASKTIEFDINETEKKSAISEELVSESDVGTIPVNNSASL